MIFVAARPFRIYTLIHMLHITIFTHTHKPQVDVDVRVELRK